MKLTDLGARFIRWEQREGSVAHVRADVLSERPTGPFSEDDVENVPCLQTFHVYVDTLAQADGIMFRCPKCTHQVLCWFVGKVPDSVDPKPGRWIPRGTGVGDLSFVTDAQHPLCSVKLDCAHFYVRDGSIVLLPS